MWPLRPRPPELARVVAHYNHRARVYDRNLFTRFIGRAELQALLQLLPPADQALDYGCGSGRVALALAQRGYQVTAYDPAERMLALAREKARRAGLAMQFVPQRALLASQRFQLVTCVGVLDYYPSAAPLLRELAGLTVPGGYLLISAPNALSPLGHAYRLLASPQLPVHPRVPQALWQEAQAVGLRPLACRYAFPALPPAGMTVLLLLQRPAGR
ncbi:MAG: class I SAM-dependent methyltransferase [Deinococcus sp.]|nr:class I SAM-dependent methyltransferase [Deinococcus sp.]